MRYALSFIVLLFWQNCFAVNYYVSPAGSDSNTGLSVSAPFKTLQHAADLTVAGDTVFAMAGVYTDTAYGHNVLNIYNNGTAANPIVYKNYMLDVAVIKLYAQWGGIQIQGADYIIIDGFTVIGNNDSVTLAYALTQTDSLSNPATSGNGIEATFNYSDTTNMPHHIIIRNCNVSKCGGGGIGTYHADYVTVDHNMVWGCGWYSPYDESGISLYQNWNSDSSTDIKNYVTRNTCYANENYIPSHTSGTITDGNAIIIDDSRNTQNGSPLGVYVGKTYIANNVVYNNGGRGIHAYSSDKVIVVNNTCYKNCRSAAVPDGELTSFYTDSTYFINNISLPDSGIPPMNTYMVANGTVMNNLWAANESMANPYGVRTDTGAVQFVFPSADPALANFSLQATSAAIGRGTIWYAPADDINGVARPAFDSVDIGAYKYFTGDRVPVLTQPFSISVFPDPAINDLWIDMRATMDNSAHIIMYNSTGKIVLATGVDKVTGYTHLDVSRLRAGVYFVRVYAGDNKVGMSKFCK